MTDPLPKARDLEDFAQAKGDSSGCKADLFFARSGLVVAAVFPALPTADTVATFIAVLDSALARGKHYSLVDFSELERVDTGAFGNLLSALDQRRAQLGACILRQTLVHPQSLAGAFVAGFHAIFQPPYPAQVHMDRLQAIADLDASLDASAILRRLDAAKGELISVPDWLRDLRRYLQREMAQASLEGAARALLVSTRTLQRQLQSQQRTFSDELDLVRLAAADDRLKGTREKLIAIASDLGFSSAEHFSDWYKRKTGVSPSSAR